MQWFRADMHIHTVLSPCGDLDMAPERIVDQALQKGLDIIAITDHNTTLQCEEIIDIGREKGLMVLGGCEVNTLEEVHCVALFENELKLKDFQVYLDNSLPDIPNDPEIFGYQVWVNRKEEILGEETRLLWSALNKTIDQVIEYVGSLGGIFFPAHIDRPVNGILRQLGWIPDNLDADAVEIAFPDKMDKQLLEDIKNKFQVIMNSDAHSLEQIGQRYTLLKMAGLSFNEIKKALRAEDGRMAKPGKDVI